MLGEDGTLFMQLYTCLGERIVSWFVFEVIFCKLQDESLFGKHGNCGETFMLPRRFPGDGEDGDGTVMLLDTILRGGEI